MAGYPIVTVASGGLPVTYSTDGNGWPVEEALSGLPVTAVAAGGLPVAGPSWTTGADLAVDYTTGGNYGAVSGAFPPGTDTHAQTIYAPNAAGLFLPFGANVLTRTDLGLQTVPTRTNLALWSQEFDNAAWTKTDVVVTANNAVAPDGTTTADLLTEGTAGTAQTASASTVTIVASSTNTYSVYLRPGTATWVQVIASNGANSLAGWFNLATGAAGSVANGGSATGSAITIRPLANGFFLCTLTGVLSSDTLAVIRFRSASADGSSTRVNNATYWAWQAQIEAGTFASLPILTTGTAATVNGNQQVIDLSAMTTLGAELVTNGDFASGANWAISGSGITISGGTLNWDGTAGAFGTNNVVQLSLAVDTDKTYAITYTVARTAGSIRLNLGVGGATVGPARSASGTYTDYIKPTGSTPTTLVIQGDNFNGTLDNVSVKQATGLAEGVAGIVQVDQLGIVNSGPVVEINSGSSNNSVRLRWNAGGTQLLLEVIAGAAIQAQVFMTASGTGLKTIAFAASPNYANCRTVGATLPTAGTVVTYPTMDRVGIGGLGYAATLNQYQYTRKLALSFGPQDATTFAAMFARAEIMAASA